MKPVHLDYRSPLPGAPKTKALPAELHVEFSLPGQVKDGVQSAPVFPLACVAPAGAEARRDVVGRAARRTQRALALPPRNGATAALKAGLAALDAPAKAQAELALLDVKLAHAFGYRWEDGELGGCVDPVCPADMAGADTADLEALAAWAAGPKAGLSPARREAAAAVLRERSAKLLALDEANHRARAAASAVDERTAGATAAKARVVLLRDERSEERGRWGMFQ